MGTEKTSRLACVLGLAVLASACNSELLNQVSPPTPAAPSPGTHRPAPARPGAPPYQCRVIVSEDQYNLFLAEKNAILDDYFVEPGGIRTCNDPDRKKLVTGYTSFTIYAPLQVSGEAQFVDGAIQIPIAAAPVDSRFRTSLASEFGLGSADAEALHLQEIKSSDYPLQTDAEAESLPRVNVGRKQVGSETLLVLSRKKRIKEKKAKAFLEAFAQGKVGIRTYTWPGSTDAGELGTGSILLHAKGHHGKNLYKRTNKLEQLASFWARAELAQPDALEAEGSPAADSADQDRDDVLRIAIQWRYALSRLAKERVRETLQPMIDYASRRWVPKTPVPQAETAATDLLALEFLGSIGTDLQAPGGIARYYSMFERLLPYFGFAGEPSPHSLALLTEILEIVDQGSFTSEQLNAIQGIASSLNPYDGTGDPAAWVKAKEICRELNFDNARIGRFSQLLWPLVAERWRTGAGETATRLLDLMRRRPEIADPQFALLTQLFAWFGYEEMGVLLETPAAAIAHTDCLVFQRNMPADKLEKLKESVRMHLSIGLSPERALEQSELELLNYSCPTGLTP